MCAGIVVGCDLKELRGILQTMDLIQHDALSGETFQKALRVEHRSTDAREFTVEIFNVRKVLTQARLSNAANARKPDHGSVLPRPLQQFQPEMPVYHMKVCLHIVALNANSDTSGRAN